MGVALYMLVRDLPGRAATISRLAIGPFVLFYAAWETVIGLAIGVLVQHANDAPAGERPAVSDAIQAVGENAIVGDAGVLLVVGALAWITAVIAAAVAVRRAGAPILAPVLLGAVGGRGLAPAADRTDRPGLLRGGCRPPRHQPTNLSRSSPHRHRPRHPRSGSAPESLRAHPTTSANR